MIGDGVTFEPKFEQKARHELPRGLLVLPCAGKKSGQVPLRRRTQPACCWAKLPVPAPPTCWYFRQNELTNDLDIDTLELLEQLLTDYTDTVFLVSHDRTFL